MILPTTCRMRRTYHRTSIAAALLLLVSASYFPVSAADGDLKTLWQIGEADKKNAEFALAPGGYDQFAADGFYAVGRSDSREAWPFIHPGPADSWAGGRKHDFQIVFALRSAPNSGSRLVVRFLDTQSRIPPRLRVQVNNASEEIQLPAGGGDDSFSGRFNRSKPFVWTIPLPAKALVAGTNKVTISSIAGSWALYDSISLEAPPETEVTETNPVLVESVEAQSVLDRDKVTGALMQPVVARVHNFGPATTAILRMNGRATTARLPVGVSQISVPAPEPRTPTKARLIVQVGGQQIADDTVTLTPVRHWTIHLLAHSHVDIGYTQPQEDVRLKQISNFREALELIKKTANYPADSQFKWNLEVLWPMEAYLRNATPAQRKELLDAIRSRKLIINAYYGNLLTGLCSPQELLRASAPSLRMVGEAGVGMDTAMQTDTPGYTWGNVTAMSQAGVKYFSMGPNAGDRTGRSLIQWHDKPFYWVSPSGKSKVLCWMTYGGYSLGHNLGKKLIPFIPGYLDGLEQSAYPYDIACLRWCVNGDNGSPDEALAATVRDWNKAHAFPHLVISASRDPFVELEKRYGSKIPTYRGDFTPYWEDGVASTARETALKRNATDRLVQAQSLWVMQERPNFPIDRFRTAWEDAMLYSEHTWGAYNSVSQPDAAFVKSEWAYKQAFAVRADAESKKLLAAAAGISAQIDVFNTESWVRTDLAIIPADKSKIGDRVVDAAGKTVPSQRLADGTLAVLVRDIAPFSSRRYSLLPGNATPMGSASARGNTLTNSLLTVKIDPTSGAISDLRMKGLPDNLVDAKSKTAVNDYFYLPGGDVKNLVRSGAATVTVEDAGPLVATLRIESGAPGTRRLTRRVRLASGVTRVDMADIVDKQAIREKEGVHIGFGFNVPNPVMRMDMPLSVVRPEQDQLIAANRNWYPVQHWVDVSNSRYGVTWATRDAPLVEVGGITANIPGFVSQTDERWIQRIKSSATFYSWVMNNHWHTNYKADQEGPVTFRYAIAPHGVFVPEQAAKFGQGVNRPLLALSASGTAIKGSLLQVSAPGVTVAELKPSDDGKAWIVRLWGASGRDQNVRLTWKGLPVSSANLSDTSEKAGAKVGPNFSVSGYGITTLRIARN
ncbi:hypothetical protein EON83_20080 [bacterium]|nr:MAG: hypothetical protein EON83_20080 [bacterium]